MGFTIKCKEKSFVNFILKNDIEVIAEETKTKNKKEKNEMGRVYERCSN